MKNYFNKYNVINVTAFIWIVSFVLERLSLFLFFQMNLEPLLLNQAYLFQQKQKLLSHYFAAQLKLAAK